MDFCGHGAIEFTRDYHMIATKEEDLMVSGTFLKKPPVKKPKPAAPAAPKAEAKPAPTPEVGTVIKPRDDGKPVQVPSKCVYCTICAKKCPAGALEVDRAAKTWTLNEDECVACGTCAEACPKKAILMPGDEPVTVEAAAPAAPKAEVKPAAPAPAAGTVIKPRDDGKPVQVPSKCVYCTICAKKCPAGALEVDRAAKTWTLDEDSCVACGTCAEACPKKAILMPGDEPVTEGAAAPAPAPKAEAKPAPAPKAEEKPAAPAAAPAEAPKAQEKPAELPKPRDDGRPVQDPSKCVYCTICAKKCPVGALEVDRAAKTWKLDEDLCIGCGNCAIVCPKQAILY